MNPESLLRPHIRAMEPYIPILPFEVLSEQLGISADKIIKLDGKDIFILDFERLEDIAKKG